MTDPDRHVEAPGLTVDEVARHLKAAIARGFVGVSITLSIRADGLIRDNISHHSKGTTRLSNLSGLTNDRKSRKLSM